MTADQYRLWSKTVPLPPDWRFYDVDGRCLFETRWESGKRTGFASYLISTNSVENALCYGMQFDTEPTVEEARRHIDNFLKGQGKFSQANLKTGNFPDRSRMN